MIASLLAVVLLAPAQTPPPAAPGPVESIAVEPARIAASPRVSLRVTEGGKPVAYQGVPLAALLPKDNAGRPGDSMAVVKGFSDAVIVVRGSDGYQVAVSAAAVAMDPAGERYLLAIARDGKPLDDKHGPVQLIVPGDPQRVRWCHGVASARLVRLGALLDAR